VSDLLDEFLALKKARAACRPGTIEGYRRDFAKQFSAIGRKRVTEVTRSDIRDLLFRGDGSRFTSPRSHNKAATFLTGLFRFATEMGYIAASPLVPGLHRVSAKTDRKDRLRARTRISGEELAAVMKAALVHPDPRVGMAVILAGHGGMRLREITHVRLRDVTTDVPGITVASGFACGCRDCEANGGVRRTKTDLDRWVPLLPDEAEAIASRVEHLRALGLGDDAPLLAVTERRPRTAARLGDPTPADWIAADVKPVLTAALKRDLRPGERFHLLRAAARVRLSHAPGLSPEDVDRVLGHELEGARSCYDFVDRQALHAKVARAFGVPMKELVKKVG
jgi:integrase